jgi:hypothetical protein
MDAEETLRFIAQEAKDGLVEVRKGVPNAAVFWLEAIERRALAVLPCQVEIPGAGTCELKESEHEVVAGRRIHRRGPVTWNGTHGPWEAQEIRADYEGASRSWIVLEGPNVGMAFRTPDPDPDDKHMKRFMEMLEVPDGCVRELIGGSLSRVEYAALFEVLSTKFGAKDDKTFELPDMRGKVVPNG